MKTFNCPMCGPVLSVRVHGDWFSADLKDVAFEVRRPEAEEFSAKVTEETKLMVPNVLKVPKYEVEAEVFVEEVRKVCCMKCGEQFQLPKPKPKPDPNAIANTPLPNAPWSAPTPMFGGSNGISAATEQMLDQRLSDTDIDLIIVDMGEDPLNFPSKADKLAWLVDQLS